MSFTVAAIALGAASVASAGIAAATQPGAPDAPDYGRATREGIEADIDTMGRRKEIEALARMGGELLKEGYTKRSVVAGGEDAQAEISRISAELQNAKAELDRLNESGRPEYQNKGIKGGFSSLFSSQQDYDSSLESAQARYDSLNAQLLAAETPGSGNIDLYFDADGNPVTSAEAVDTDFTGISDIDQSVAAARAQLDFMSESAQAQLNLQDQFGSQFIQQQLDLLKEADPTGFAIREQMGDRILAEGFGTNLSDSQRAEVEQATRAGQAARGNIFGAAPAAAEAMQTGDAGYRLQQQRLANASAFLSGQTPQAQFGQISNAQQGAVPTGSFNMLSGIGPNPNAGAQGAQFASSNYSTQSGNWATGLSNDPWQSLLGSVTQVGVQGAANSIFGGAGTYQGNDGISYRSNPFTRQSVPVGGRTPY